MLWMSHGLTQPIPGLGQGFLSKHGWNGAGAEGDELIPVSYPQEFCLFAVVGLVSDFFLQMFFFTTVLSIDIRRMEVGRGHGLPGEGGQHRKNQNQTSTELGRDL